MKSMKEYFFTKSVQAVSCIYFLRADVRICSSATAGFGSTLSDPGAG